MILAAVAIGHLLISVVIAGLIFWLLWWFLAYIGLPEPFAKLLPLHKRLGPPAPGEWLAVQQEPGQTYEEYVRGKPVRPDKTRRVIYVQPLGTLSKTERKVVQLTADYMAGWEKAHKAEADGRHHQPMRQFVEHKDVVR